MRIGSGVKKAGLKLCRFSISDEALVARAGSALRFAHARWIVEQFEQLRGGRLVSRGAGKVNKHQKILFILPIPYPTAAKVDLETIFLLHASSIVIYPTPCRPPVDCSAEILSSDLRCCQRE